MEKMLLDKWRDCIDYHELLGILVNSQLHCQALRHAFWRWLVPHIPLGRGLIFPSIHQRDYPILLLFAIPIQTGVVMEIGSPIGTSSHTTWTGCLGVMHHHGRKNWKRHNCKHLRAKNLGMKSTWHSKHVTRSTKTSWLAQHIWILECTFFYCSNLGGVLAFTVSCLFGTLFAWSCGCY